MAIAGEDDQQLVAAAQAGDRRALDALIERHYERVYAVCRRMMGNEADALDATQESVILILRGLPGFDGRARFSTWAYRIATNACLEEFRRRGRRPTAGADELDDRTTPSVSGGQVAVDERLAIDAALEAVAPEYRAAVVLRDQLGLEYAEIAEALGIPIGTVRSRIARGRVAVAERLGTFGIERPSNGATG